MRTELCSFCLKSGILCKKCSAKVKSGEISELDLKIARLLLSLERKYPSLQNICFYKAVGVGKTLAIMVGHGCAPASELWRQNNQNAWRGNPQVCSHSGEWC